MPPLLDAARAYLGKLPPAISGDGGHDATFAAACWAVRFGLSDADALPLLIEYNRRCQPPWTEKELTHKLRDARRVAGSQGHAYHQPRPAERVVWKVERKANRATDGVMIPAAPVLTERKQSERPRPEAIVNLPPDCVPWLHVAKQVLAGDFDDADRSTRESISIGLRSIDHPDCRRALERLKATKA